MNEDPDPELIQEKVKKLNLELALALENMVALREKGIAVEKLKDLIGRFKQMKEETELRLMFFQEPPEEELSSEIP